MSYLTGDTILKFTELAGPKGVEHLTFDIETAPILWDNLPIEVHSYITKKALKSSPNLSILNAITKYKSLNPLFGQISCICIKGPGFHTGFWGLDEKRIIADFWHAMSILYPTRIVSYNGKTFDTHFINIRSAIQEIPSTYTISTNKWDSFNHFDVADIISGFSNYNKISMDITAQMMLGVIPKETPGDLMAQLYANEDFEAIGQHCMRDVEDTESLFFKLNSYYTKKPRIDPF